MASPYLLTDWIVIGCLVQVPLRALCALLAHTRTAQVHTTSARAQGVLWGRHLQQWGRTPALCARPVQLVRTLVVAAVAVPHCVWVVLWGTTGPCTGPSFRPNVLLVALCTALVPACPAVQTHAECREDSS